MYLTDGESVGLVTWGVDLALLVFIAYQCWLSNRLLLAPGNATPP